MIAMPRRRYDYTRDMVDIYGPTKLDEVDYEFIRDAWWVSSVLREMSQSAVDELASPNSSHVHSRTWLELWIKIDQQATTFKQWMHVNRQIDYAPTDPELDELELIMLRVKTFGETYTALNQNLALTDEFEDADLAIRHVISNAVFLTKKIQTYRKKRAMADRTALFLNTVNSKKKAA